MTFGDDDEAGKDGELQSAAHGNARDIALRAAVLRLTICVCLCHCVTVPTAEVDENDHRVRCGYFGIFLSRFRSI